MAGCEIPQLPEGWSVKPLIECTEDRVISYGIVQPGSHDDEGVPIVRVNNFTGGGLDLSSVLRVAPSIEEKYSRTRLKGGEVLLTLVGSTGQSVVAPDSLEGWNVPRAVAVIRPAAKIGARWVNICLQSQATKNFLDVRANTTVQKTLNLKDVREIPVLVPPDNDKRIIESTIGALDDKIELNRQMNTTLEAMAQALFKSWFVDFDPVIDKALAAGNAIPEPLQARAAARRAVTPSPSPKGRGEHRQSPLPSGEGLGEGSLARKPLPEAIQKQFPDRFVFNEEMGWVPEGWGHVLLSDLASKISKGTTPPKDELATTNGFSEVPFIKVKDITDDGQIAFDGLDRVSRTVHEVFLKRSILRTDDILFSIAGTIGRCTLVPNELDDSNANQAVAFVRPKDSAFRDLIFGYLRSASVKTLVDSRVVQAVQANFSLTELGTLTMLWPGKSVIECWNALSRPNMARIQQLQAQNRRLANLRDTLLPKLLSGELRVPDAEKAVAAVT